MEQGCDNYISHKVLTEVLREVIVSKSYEHIGISW